MRHAFGIPTLTKSRFGKYQSYKVLNPDRRYGHLVIFRRRPTEKVLNLLVTLQVFYDMSFVE